MAGQVTINSQRFVLAGPITHYPTQTLSPAFRQQGTQRRLDNQKINRYVHQGFPLGLGYHRMDRETGRGVGGLKDSTCETRFRQITLNLLNESETHASPADHVKAYLHYNGDLWGLFEEDYASDAITDLVARKWGATSDNWTGGGTIQSGDSNAVGQRILAATTYLKHAIIVTNGNAASGGVAEADICYYHTTDMASFTQKDPSIAAALNTTVTRRNNFDDRLASVLGFGNVLLLAVGDADDLETTAYRSISPTASSPVWTTGDTVEGLPRGIFVWRDPTIPGAPTTPVLVTTHNVYTINTMSAALNPILPEGVLGGNANDALGCAVGDDGNLYVSTANGSIFQISTLAAGHIQRANIGPNRRSAPINSLYVENDGFVSEAQGFATSIIAAGTPWLWIAYGGNAADKHARVYCFDYYLGSWHTFYRHGTANLDLYAMALSLEDDDTMRLHIAVEGASAADMDMFEQPLVPAVTGVTQKYQTDGYLKLPTDDLGDPQSSSVLLQARVDAEDLSGNTSGEFILHEDGTDGASDTTNDRGDYLNGATSLSYGTNNVGISARTVSTKLTLDRGGTNTNTPKLNEFELGAKNKLQFLRGYQVPIDLGATAREERITPTEVRSRLDDIYSSVVLVPFVIGRDASINVECVNFVGSPITSPSQSEVLETEEYTGTVTLQLEEVYR
jgi:hypothetical protein